MKEISKEIKLFKSLKNKKLFDETKDKKYLKTAPMSIMYTIRTPIYANLQFKNNKFKITNEDIFNITNVTKPIINRELFHECCNVDKVIDGDMWYQSVEKWKASNLKRSDVGEKVETQLFKNLLFCKFCGEKIWFTANNFKCKTGCINISKDVAVNKILFSILIKLVEDDHFKRLMNNKIDAMNEKITQFEETLSINAKLIKNSIVKMVINSESADGALTKFFNKERNINEKLSVLKMKRIDLIYLRDNIKSLVISPKIITELKEMQDYLQLMLQNLIKKVYIDDSKEQTRTTITFNE